MTDNRIKIVVEAITKNLEKNLNGASKSISKFAAGLQVAAAATFAAGIAKAALELKKLADQLDAVRTRLSLTAGSAQEAQQYIRAVQSATEGLTTETQAANIALQAMNYGFAESPQQVGELARNILILSNGNAELADSFLYMLSSGVGSIERLNEYGLSAAEVRARMKELQAANADMTTDAAFAAAVLGELDENASRLGGTLNTAAAESQQTATAIEDLKLAFAAGVSEGIQPATDALHEFVTGLNEARKASQDQQQTALETADSFDEYIRKMAEVEGLFGLSADEIREGGAAAAEALDPGMVELLLARYNAYHQEIRDGQQAAQDYVDAQRDIDRYSRQTGDSIIKLTRATDEAAQANKRLGESAREMATDPINDLNVDLFEDTADKLSESAGNRLRGAASIGGGKEDDNAEDIKRALYEEIINKNPDIPLATRIRFMMALGIATPQQIALAEEFDRIAQLAAEGRLTDGQLAAAGNALAGRNAAAASQIQGSAPAPRQSTPPSPTKGAAGLDDFGTRHPGSGVQSGPTFAERGAATFGGNTNHTVRITGVENLQRDLEQGFTEALKAAMGSGGAQVHRSGPRPRMT
jgi:hypothetical protein